jgi:hypothetical protein
MSEATGSAPEASELADRLARLRARLDEFRGRL